MIRRSFSAGGPSGKPGPAKLAKQRFRRALYAALSGSEAELELSKADNVIAAIARRMARDAAAGRVSATRLLLSLLDKASAADAEDDVAEQLFTGAELFSLLQGKIQGNEKQWLEEILRPDTDEKPARIDSPHPKNTPSQSRSAISTSTRFSTSPQGRGTTSALSLVQGKTQGKPEKKICPVLHASPRPPAARAQLMTGTAPGFG